MKKSDLRTGMRVTLKSGRELIVLLNAKHLYSGSADMLVEVGENTWYGLDTWDENLNAEFDCDDIVMVEIPTHIYAVMGDGTYKYDVLWDRNTKEVTMKDIEEKFGYKVKIVG